MFHFTPPSSPRGEDQRSLPSTSSQTIPSAEFADPASSAFAAAILDPRTGSDSGHSSLDPTAAIPVRSFPSRLPPTSPRDRPSLPELQSRATYASSPSAALRGRPVLSRHASEGTFQPGAGVEQERATVLLGGGAVPPQQVSSKVVEAKTNGEGEDVGSFNGMGRDILASTPPPRDGIPTKTPASAPPAPPVHPSPPAPQPPLIVPRVTSPVPLAFPPSASFVRPSHLPDIEAGQTGPTALQNWDVSGEMEFTLAKVVRAEVVDEVLEDSNALGKFREYIETKGSDPLLLDLYNDLKLFADLSTQLRLASSSILQAYLQKNSPSRLVLPISLRGPILASLGQTSSLNLSLLAPLHDLLNRLFEREFKPYLQQKLVEHAVGRLGSWKAGYGWTGASDAAPNMVSDGLADCYCLTNPRLKDNPIVLASQGFSQLTGYPLDSIISRNCRFLQGPGTAPESTLRLREALNAGEGITSLLLNYRLDGTPFYNLLCMLPLKDASGAVKYFLGGQIDVTGAISSFSSLALPAFASSAPPGSASHLPQANGATPAPKAQGGPRFTPLVQAQVDHLSAATKAGRVDPALDARKAGELVSATAFSSLPAPQGDQTLVGTVKGEDAKGKGKAKEINGDEENDDGSSRSTLSVHASKPVPSSSRPSLPERRRAASLDSARSRRSSFGQAAGAGVRAAADAIAHAAVEGARKIRRVGSKDSSASVRGEGMGNGARWEAEGKEGDEAWDREREKEKERVKQEGKKRVGPLVARLHQFEATYSRVMLVRQSTREILFCTPEVVEHCGLSSSAQFDLTSVDFTRALFAVTSSASPPITPFSAAENNGDEDQHVELKAERNEDEEHTRRLRRNVRLAIEGGHSWTGLVGLRPVTKGVKLGKHKHGEPETKVCVLHLTPLCDKDGNCEAFVAVFG
ncbi:hypothetical protein JCM6882_008485 [Rhodosporidiobolus microsporus]